MENGLKGNFSHLVCFQPFAYLIGGQKVGEKDKDLHIFWRWKIRRKQMKTCEKMFQD